MNIFVSNIERSVTPNDLQRAFSGYGTIIDVKLLKDKETGKPLHGHVYLVPERAAREAMEELNLAPLRGRPIKVRECIYRANGDRRERQLPGIKVERRRSHDRRHRSEAKVIAASANFQS